MKQAYEHNATPRITNTVREVVDHGCITLEWASHSAPLDEIESVIWALCKPGISTVDEIQFQFSTLQLTGEHDHNHAVEAALQRFNELGLLKFIESDIDVYPINTSSYSHIFSSRGGLYGFNEKGYKRLARGMFFGICPDDKGGLLAYEFPHLKTSLWRQSFSVAKKDPANEGLIWRFDLANQQISPPHRLHTELTNNCHHLLNTPMGIVGVDTERQSIFFIADNGQVNSRAIFKNEPYHHINSLLQTGDYWLVLRSIESPANLISSVGVFDSHWQSKSTIQLNAERAHDLEPDYYGPFDELGLSFWYCDSNHDHIRHYPSGRSIHVESGLPFNNTTRGLSQTEDCWIVGAGQYGRYYGYSQENSLLGAISYISKDSGKLRTRISVPEAPCCIIPNPAFKSSET